MKYLIAVKVPESRSWILDNKPRSSELTKKAHTIAIKSFGIHNVMILSEVNLCDVK